MKEKKEFLFGDPEQFSKWKKEWKGMPEFTQNNLEPHQSVLVHFDCEEDKKEFADLIQQKITAKTKSLWYPKITVERIRKRKYITKKKVNPKYPVYIPSKGRWETRYTSKALEEMDVPYRIVVEPDEYDNYASVIDPKKILKLPQNNMKLIGSRNWIMEHSISEGAERHWQLDDNIGWFGRVNNNFIVPVYSGVIFRCAEDFVDRYTNVAYAGFQYETFVHRKWLNPAFDLNTRIYSCTLVNNSIPYRWRSIYNDDTDVSLCALKDKWCTVLFYVFVQQKKATMTVKGGNTESLYLIQDGRLKMAEALTKLHPDVSTIVWKWNRWQHRVDYRMFKRRNKLIKKKGIEIPEGIDNYGMILKTKT